MTIGDPTVMLRIGLVGCVLLAASCATRSLPRRIPVAAALPPPDKGVHFDVKTLAAGAGADWELVLDAGRGTVLLTPGRAGSVLVPFGEHTVRGTVTVFETHAVNTTTRNQYGTQTTFVRTAVGSCSATLDVTVHYVETRRLEVDVARQDCAIREVEVSAY